MNACSYCGSTYKPVLGRCFECGNAHELVVEIKPLAPIKKATRAPGETSGRDLAIYFGSGLLLIVIFITFFYVMDKWQPVSVTPAPSAPSLEQVGYYLDYKYSFIKDGDRVTALFLPKILPADDAVVMGAVKRVISQAYGKEISSTPKIINRELVIDGFYVMIVKESTGEINSLIIHQ